MTAFYLWTAALVALLSLLFAISVTAHQVSQEEHHTHNVTGTYFCLPHISSLAGVSRQEAYDFSFLIAQTLLSFARAAAMLSALLSSFVVLLGAALVFVSPTWRDAFVDTLRFYGSFLHYWVLGGSYAENPYFRADRRARVHLYSMSLIMFLWDRPHYRSGTFQKDMIKNLRNVALPGTGIPLSLLCYSRISAIAFLLFGYPLACLVYAVFTTRPLNPRAARSTSQAYRDYLLRPDDWFNFWRLNCRLASFHSMITRGSGYAMEDKFDFLVAADKAGIPVSPFYKVGGIVVKDRNEEGGMGIRFYKNATAGGEWILQETLGNSESIAKWLPENAPLSTMRVVTASYNAVDAIEGKMVGSLEERLEKISVLGTVFRAGRAGASTDHTSVLFDVDRNSGKIIKGTTNDHWYRLWGSVFGNKKCSSSFEAHPDCGTVLVGQQFEHMEEILELTRRAHATLLPDVPLGGWDVALTSNEVGICLLEVNLSCNFFNASFDRSQYFDFVDQCFSKLDPAKLQMQRDGVQKTQ